MSESNKHLHYRAMKTAIDVESIRNPLHTNDAMSAAYAESMRKAQGNRDYIDKDRYVRASSDRRSIGIRTALATSILFVVGLVSPTIALLSSGFFEM